MVRGRVHALILSISASLGSTRPSRTESSSGAFAARQAMQARTLLCCFAGSEKDRQKRSSQMSSHDGGRSAPSAARSLATAAACGARHAARQRVCASAHVLRRSGAQGLQAARRRKRVHDGCCGRRWPHGKRRAQARGARREPHNERAPQKRAPSARQTARTCCCSSSSMFFKFTGSALGGFLAMGAPMAPAERGSGCTALDVCTSTDALFGAATACSARGSCCCGPCTSTTRVIRAEEAARQDVAAAFNRIGTLDVDRRRRSNGRDGARKRSTRRRTSGELRAQPFSGGR